MDTSGLTAVAAWLNTAWQGFDYAILSFYHSLAVSAGGFLNPVLGTLTLTAWKGAFLILMSLILIAFRKTRRTGICTLLAIIIGALFTNVLIKHAVSRPRPYNFDQTTLRAWWIYVGSHMESDLSFPSGHMTAACAFTSAFVLSRGWKWLPVGVVYVVLMGASRNYLMVHYPTDVIAGFLFGTIAGIISYFLVRAVYRRFGESRLLREAGQ